MGYVIGVYTQDSSSTLVFKSNGGVQSDDRYKVQQEDTVIPGIYRNMFQYVTMPIVSHLQTNKSLQDRVSVITDSRQLVLSITSEVASRTYHHDVLKLRSYDDLEQCLILAVRSIKEQASIGSGDKDLDDSLDSKMVATLASVISQEIYF